MKIAKVVRCRADDFDTAFVFQTIENGHISLNGMYISLYGPKWSSIAEGTIQTNLQSGEDSLCLEVMVEINWKKRTYRWERWYITFENVNAVSS